MRPICAAHFQVKKPADFPSFVRHIMRLIRQYGITQCLQEATMSTGKLTTSRPTQSATTTAVRLAEQAVRQARIQWLTHQARTQIQAEECRYQKIQERLDEAATRLPDLKFTGLVWQAPPPDATLEALNVYLSTIRGQIDGFDREANRAIQHAEALLKRRQAKARAWQRSQDIEAQQLLNKEACQTLAERLGHVAPREAFPPRPSREAELEEVESYLAACEAVLKRQSESLTRLRQQAQHLAQARKTSGPAIGDIPDAQAALAAHSQAEIDAALARFNASLQQALGAHRLQWAQLPGSMQHYLDAARAMAADNPHRDWSRTLHDYLGRESRRRADIERARQMLLAPPAGVYDDPELHGRWERLSQHLQAILGGLEYMTQDFEAEFAQLRRDIQQRLNNRLSNASLIAALEAHGMQVLDTEQGTTIVNVDEHTWFELAEHDTDKGVAHSFELQTDAPVGSINESSKIAEACNRLTAAIATGNEPNPNVHRQLHELRGSRRIGRAHRPALGAMAL